MNEQELLRKADVHISRMAWDPSQRPHPGARPINEPHVLLAVDPSVDDWKADHHFVSKDERDAKGDWERFPFEDVGLPDYGIADCDFCDRMAVAAASWDTERRRHWTRTCWQHEHLIEKWPTYTDIRPEEEK